MNNETNNKEEYLNNLITLFGKQRDALLVMISDLEKVKIKVDTLFPEQLDNRSVFRFQEKIKAVSELFKSILEIRKEIMKSIKDEIDLRKKVSTDEGDDTYLDDTDIKNLADKVQHVIKIHKKTVNEN